MLNVKKTLQMTSLMFGMMILFCYIGWHLGYEGFIIVGDIQMPYPVQFLICFVLLFINLTLYGGFVLRKYAWSILLYSLPLTCTIAIRDIWFTWIPGTFIAGVLPILVWLIIAIKQKLPLKRTILSLLFINGVMLVHQFIVSKITQTPLTYDVSIYTILRLSIDTILVKLLFYSMGGVRYALERMVFPGQARDERSRNEICQNDSQSTVDVPIDKFEKWVMRSVIGVVQIMQWGFILWVCNLDNLFLDALVMTTSFICHGMIISKRKHLKPIILCTLVATAMFYFSARFTISVQYSQLFPIIIGLILAYTVYRISYQFEISAKESVKKDLERIKALEKQVENAWDRFDELSSF